MKQLGKKNVPKFQEINQQKTGLDQGECYMIFIEYDNRKVINKCKRMWSQMQCISETFELTV